MVLRKKKIDQCNYHNLFMAHPSSPRAPAEMRFALKSCFSNLNLPGDAPPLVGPALRKYLQLCFFFLVAPRWRFRGKTGSPKHRHSRKAATRDAPWISCENETLTVLFLRSAYTARSIPGWGSPASTYRLEISLAQVRAVVSFVDRETWPKKKMSKRKRYFWVRP